MERIGFPGLEEHKGVHAQFLRDVEKLRGEIDAGDRVAMDRLLVFLQGWLIGHIIGVDRQYSGHTPE